MFLHLRAISVVGLFLIGNVYGIGTDLLQQQTNHFPADEEYRFTDYTEFGECSKVCGGGRRVRVRSCLNSNGVAVKIEKCYDHLPITSYDVVAILKYGNEMEEEDGELCNIHECQTSEWVRVSACTQECGGGTSTYSRKCYSSADQHKCNFQSKRLAPCNTHPCYRYGEWKEWSSCSEVCGNYGVQTRSRECEPNASNVELYQKLSGYMNYFWHQLFNRMNSPEQIHYFTQYLAACGSRHDQERPCNRIVCPQCPFGQIYQSCMPCTKHCSSVSLNDIRRMSSNFVFFTLSQASRGCNGRCEPGCACPPSSPYLGSNNLCYRNLLGCPENTMSMTQLQRLFYGLSVPTSSDPSPTTKPTLPSVARSMPTVEITPPTTTTTTVSTTTSTSEAPTTTTVNSNLLKLEKPVCPMDIPILQHDFCICRGVFHNVLCVTAPGDKCPIVCKEFGTCPVKTSSRYKDTVGCNSEECFLDSQCKEGQRCCELLCGRRCVQVQ